MEVVAKVLGFVPSGSLGGVRSIRRHGADRLSRLSGFTARGAVAFLRDDVPTVREAVHYLTRSVSQNTGLKETADSCNANA